MSQEVNRRILLVDDNPSIHADYRKILGAQASANRDFDALAGAFFGESDGSGEYESYELESAMQGEEALAKLTEARRAGRPFAVAFVDVRMPPGWDGVETLARLWEVDPDLQAVICTAFSDYSYEQMLGKLGRSQNLLILKKPFDTVEVQQLASALTQKWTVTLAERLHLEEIRAYASSLETVNRALSSDKAMSEAFANGHAEFALGAAATLERLTVELVRAAEGGADLRGTGRCLRQVAGLLRTEFERYEPKHGAVHTADLLRVLEQGAKERGLALELSPADDVPESFAGDRDAMGEVLRGMLSALAAAGAKRVQVGARKGQTMRGGPLLEFSLSGGGPGLDASRLELGLDPFGPGGSIGDLSLPLARRRAQAMRAEVLVEERAGALGLVLRLEPGVVDAEAASGRGRDAA